MTRFERLKDHMSFKRSKRVMKADGHGDEDV